MLWNTIKNYKYRFSIILFLLENRRKGRQNEERRKVREREKCNEGRKVMVVHILFLIILFFASRFNLSSFVLVGNEMR
jgi:hypothetical protein